MPLICHTNEECDAFAKDLLGKDIQQLSPQGAFSCTVKGGTQVMQFRAISSALDLGIIDHARTIHGDWVHELKSLGKIPGHSSILIYQMKMLDRINYSRIAQGPPIQDEQALVCQQKSILDFAQYFAQAWNSQVVMNSTVTSLTYLEFHQKLQALSLSLPARFKAIISHCLENLHYVFDASMPWCLNHGDLCDANIIVSPTTGSPTGIIDWA